MPPPRCKVLIADDDADTADMTADLLQLEGYTVQAVYDGQQALAAAQAFAPHAVVLDIEMPGMDGCAVAAAIRRGSGGKHMILIAHSGSAPHAFGIGHIGSAGFDHWLLKPSGVNQLCALLASSLAAVRCGRCP